MQIKQILLILLLSSCSLFKKTTKTIAKGSFDLSKQIEARSLDTQTAQKETQIYSWWKDSVFYQYAQIKEQVDQAKAATVVLQENQEVKQEQTIKESEPAEEWVYGSLVFGMIVFVLMFYRRKY
ncbi:MAG: hypothetical protein EOP48_27980 [Sphingobacteriales bacterium]|nr:MAG: hypothetical protein EOP48_27980 [Sphingobacteriales bacterium]